MNSTSWNEIKWIFEQDGSLRDIYVQDVGLEDWEKVIEYLNSNNQIRFSIGGESVSNVIDKDYVVSYLSDNSGEMLCPYLTIQIDNLSINSYFFLVDQIEFDIDPKEVNSLNNYNKIENFMRSISKLLGTQITLTGENTPEFPLIKIHERNGLNKILTQKEANKLNQEQKSIINTISIIKAKIMMKFFPNRFKDRVLKSATEPYKSTKKNKNVW